MIVDVVNLSIAGFGFIHAVGRLIVRKGLAAGMNTFMTQSGLDGVINVKGGTFPL